MKSGQLIGGIAIGALLGVGIGYLIGIDTEKRNQWIRMIGSKVLGNSCCDCGDKECSCNDKDLEFESE